MAATGQTINDRLNAVRYALAGQGLARTVCKATTEEVLGPKKKHIEYLLACTDEPNVSIPQLANLLIDRSQHTSWTVVFKSLITIHHLLNYGNERFTQYLATSNHSFELNDFMDRTTPQGYGMSTFVRRYAKYINNKISSYRTLAIDLCKVKPGKDNGLRTMNMDNLCKTLPVVHNQFDSLLDFGVEAKDLNNGIIMAAFRLLYKDLNRIFVAYQEAIINLVERYFKLSRKKTREALNMYKKYLDRMDKVANFFKIVESVGLDKNEMPDTSKLTSLLTVLEDHMAQLEAKKRGTNVASPDVDDEAEEQAPPEKVTQESTGVKEQLKQPNEASDPGKSTQEQASPQASSSSKNEPAKKLPPPARPSPITMSKVTPSSEVKATTSVSPSTQEAEKKAPPERPAKPPSRPPPPSGASPQTASTSQQTPATSTLRDPGLEQAEDDKEKVQAETTISTSPTVTSPAVSSPAETQESNPATPGDPGEVSSNNATRANGSNSQDGTSGNHNESHGDETQGSNANVSCRDDNTATLPSCSNTVAESSELEAQEEQDIAQEQEEHNGGTNHVSTNNVNNHDHDNHANQDDQIDLPPPPPPIDE